MAFPGVTIGFGQEDYSQMEQAGSVSVTVLKLQDNIDRIVLNVIPVTFEQLEANFTSVDLPEEIQQIVVGVDPAECKRNHYCCSYIAFLTCI